MRLSQFLVAKKELILQAWEEFARSLPAGRELSLSALRKDAGRMIDFIAQDLETEQSDAQELAKSLGRSPQPAKSAAQDHGLARAVEHFTLSEMVSEFRALRASVTRLWLDERPPTYENLVQLVRFNEGIDQLVAESVARFMEKLNADADLFTASISHDLRDPVSSVAMSAELLTTSRSLSAEDRAVSTRIHQSAHRITVMLQELLDFTHVRLAAAGAFEQSRLTLPECADAWSMKLKRLIAAGDSS